MQASSSVTDEFEDSETCASGRFRATRPRLVVEAEDVLDAVTAAGGLIFDRASAGWEVEVRLVSCEDDRPLRILGVQPTDVANGSAAEEDTADALIVAASMLRSNEAAGTRFLAAASADTAELAVWGGEWPRGLQQGIGPVEHRLSLSAQAFKLHALKAAGVAPERCTTESFHSGHRLIDVAAPLMPV